MTCIRLGETPGQMGGKATMTCTVTVTQARLDVRLEQRQGETWMPIADNSYYSDKYGPVVGSLEARREATRQVFVACAPGAYRLAARGSAAFDGVPSGSAAWEYGSDQHRPVRTEWTMTDHHGLPEPFLDDQGFPRPLRHIRAEVESRGGRITGSGLTWRVTHPDRGLPDIGIEISPDGEVLLDAGEGLRMDVFCDEAWRVDPARSWTHLEDVLLGFLEGGFTSEVWRNEEGKVVHFRMILKGSRVDEAGGTAGSVDATKARRTDSAYPAWPAARRHGPT